MDQKVIQIGNFTGVIIPKTLLEQAGFETGSQVVIEVEPETQALIITQKGSKRLKTSITPEFLKTVEKVHELYGEALKELAKL